MISPLDLLECSVKVAAALAHWLSGLLTSALWFNEYKQYNDIVYNAIVLSIPVAKGTVPSVTIKAVIPIA